MQVTESTGQGPPDADNETRLSLVSVAKRALQLAMEPDRQHRTGWASSLLRKKGFKRPSTQNALILP